MRTRVADVEIRRVDVPRKAPLALPGGTFDSAAHVLVRVTLDDGTVGYGESSPMAIYSEETQSTVFMVIKDALGAAVVGCEIANIAEASRRLEAVSRLNPIAKAGVDMALHDALGKLLGVPVHALLGGRVRDRIRLAQPIGVFGDGEVVEAATQIAAHGFSVVTLKGSGDIRRDVGRLRAIRGAIPSETRLRLDGNAGYATSAAVTSALIDAQSLGLDEVEQPLRRHDLRGMARLARDLALPLIADESVFSAADAATCLGMGAADIVNVKVQKAGGLQSALKIAAVVDAHFAGVLVGAVQETGLGAAASLHLAATCADLATACDATHFVMEHTLLATSLPVENGVAHVPVGPGLGVEVDEDAVDHYSWEPWLSVARITAGGA